MKTHTIRNKGKTNPILTFSPGFETLLVNAHPWAARALISDLLKFTGCRLDYDQTLRFEESLKPLKEYTANQHYALSWLNSGFRSLDLSLERCLEVLDEAARSLLGEP